MIERIKAKHYTDLVDMTLLVKDTNQDFYISMNRERKSLTDIKLIRKYFFQYMKKGEVCIGERGKGYILTWGTFDKSERKYLKILAKDNKAIKDLLTVFLYQYGSSTWYIRCKIKNPINRVAQGMGFSFMHGRGEEILLCRKGVKNTFCPERFKIEYDYERTKGY